MALIEYQKHPISHLQYFRSIGMWQISIKIWKGRAPSHLCFPIVITTKIAIQQNIELSVYSFNVKIYMYEV